jgi:hypothetical protein
MKVKAFGRGECKNEMNFVTSSGCMKLVQAVRDGRNPTSQNAQYVCLHRSLPRQWYRNTICEQHAGLRFSAKAFGACMYVVPTAPAVGKVAALRCSRPKFRNSDNES